jgi:hypothetical protein
VYLLHYVFNFYASSTERYEKARNAARKAEYSSNLDTSCAEEAVQGRKRKSRTDTSKRKKRIPEDSDHPATSSTDDEEERRIEFPTPNIPFSSSGKNNFF